MMRKDYDEPRKRPTMRIPQAYIEKQARRFAFYSKMFAYSTIVFISLLFLSALTGWEVLFNIDMFVVFFVWFPSLAISASTAKYYDPWDLRSIRKSMDKK